MLEASVGFLVADAPAGQPAAAVSERLRGLERAARRMSAARASALSALRAGRGYEDDGQAGLKPWQQHLLGVSAEQARRDGLRAARLADYPCLWQALADATISESIADRILAWVARLPRKVKQWACEVLTRTAGVPGVTERDLEAVAAEIWAHARPEPADDGGGEGYVTVAATTDGVGRINGNLSAEVTEQVSIVLAALGTRNGPEDARTTAQRNHDALGEAMARLLDSGLLPEVAGRKPRIEITMDLATLRGLPGAAGAQLAWTRTRSAWLAQALACDASMQGVVTGHVVGPARLVLLTRALITRLAAMAIWPACAAPAADGAVGPLEAFEAWAPHQQAELIEQLLEWAAQALSGPAGLGACLRSALQATLTRPAAPMGARPGARMDDPSGPDDPNDPNDLDDPKSPDDPDDIWAGTAFAANPASRLTGRKRNRPSNDACDGGTACDPARCGGAGGCGTGCGGDCDWDCGGDCGAGWDITAAPEVARVLLAATRGKSLILDVGDPQDAVPYRLRRAVELRDGRCRWPGCDAPAHRAQVHHVLHRHEGGPSTMSNLVLLCSRHHLHFLHRLGWTIRLNPDASVTVTSPTGRTLHDPAPPPPPHPRR